jgi:hypothetical protein
MRTVAAQQVNVDDVVGAWKARQGRTKSAWFSFDEVEFIRARTVPNVPASQSGDRLVPEDDVTVKRSSRLVVSDGMMRYSYRGEVFNPDMGGVRNMQYISVCDGEICKNFHQNLDGEQENFPLSGFIREDTVHYDFDNRHIAPVLINLRPCNEKMGGVDLSTYKVGVRTARVGAHTCIVVEPQTRSSKHREMAYWIDPVRDFIIMRIECAKVGRPPDWSIDIDYIENDDHGWIVSGWRVVSGTPSEIMQQLSVAVTGFGINESIADSEFRFDFPANTAVVDNRSGERYIARENGEHRIVTDDELRRGAKYRDLVSTESGEAAASPEDIKRRFMVVVMVFLVSGFLVVASILYCVFQRNRST